MTFVQDINFVSPPTGYGSYKTICTEEFHFLRNQEYAANPGGYIFWQC